MQSFRHGDFVWATTRTGVVLPAVVAGEEMEPPVLVQRCKRPDRILIYFYPEKSDLYPVYRHYVRWYLLRPFKEAFLEKATKYLRKKGSFDRLESVVRDLNWAEGAHLIERLRSDDGLGKRFRCEPCPCSVCNKVVGSTIDCKVCGIATVHKKCGNVKEDTWTCSDCKADEDPLPPLAEPDTPTELPDVDSTFKALVEQASADTDLSALLQHKQKEHKGLIAEFEAKKTDLRAAKLGDVQYRLSLFRLQEQHFQARSRVKEELIDQLLSARASGFESGRGEALRKVQQALVERLLVTELRPDSIVPPIRSDTPRGKKKENKTLGEVLLKPGASCVFSRLSRCISQITTLRSLIPDDLLTVPLLNAIVKVTFDAGKQGGTDPKQLQDLLTRIRQKY